MCGIVGYIGGRAAAPVIVKGLKRLEYRGYDSAGLAVLDNGLLIQQKMVGRISQLEQAWGGRCPRASVAIGHTRWATHGEPNVVNAHPHLDCTGKIAIVHNGVIENHVALQSGLEAWGHVFRSETDTEVLVHLIEESFRNTHDLVSAVQCALSEVAGSFAILVLCQDEPDKIVAARRGSPLAIGYGENEFIVASDMLAISEHTSKVVYLGDDEMAVVSKSCVRYTTLENSLVLKEAETVSVELESDEAMEHGQFMANEIFEQPRSISRAFQSVSTGGKLLSRIHEFEEIADRIRLAPRLIFASCGTSWHSALIAKYMLEQYAKKVVTVEFASEFRYTDPLVGPRDVVVLLSQSGETADTLAALREAKRKGATTVGICNVPSSSIARECDFAISLRAGPEIGVASTKAFTSQLAILSLLTLACSRRLMTEAGLITVLEEMHNLPEKVEQILALDSDILAMAGSFFDSHDALYLGRGYNFPVALEGALKLKEISCIHAEGYPAAEMKHGPIALVDKDMPVVFIAPRDSTYEKILSNMSEVRARKGNIIAIVNEADDRIKKLSEHIIVIPRTIDMLTPMLTVIPLQLFAYHVATLKGCDVDKPRNLAKSVTVE
jgi:glucosamine--fructose-6-phosphate aminotransferase (isomerizing)